MDACEPSSQLQESLKESTKVKAEYNLLTRVPKTRVNKTKRRIPGVELRVQSHIASIVIINWRCAKNRQRGGTVCLYLHMETHPLRNNFTAGTRGSFFRGNIQGTFFQEYLGNIHSFTEHSGNNQRNNHGTFSEHSVNIQC